MKKSIILLFLLIFINGYSEELKSFKEKRIVFKIVPVAVAADAENNIYIADRFTMSILKYNSKKEYLYSFGIKNIKKESLIFSPIDIFPVDNEIYVLDINGGIYRFDYNGKYIGGVKYNRGKLRGESFGARAIFVSDYIYLVDTNNSRIQIIKRDGMPYKEFGFYGTYDGQFVYPEGITVRNNEIIVSDTGTNRVDKFDKNGFYQNSVYDKNKKFLRPTGIFSDESGHLYVLDSGNAQLKVFDKKDRLIYFIDFKIKNKKVKMEINDIWVQNGLIYVSDTLNKNIKIYDKDMKYKGEIGKGSDVMMAIKMMSIFLVVIIMILLLKKEKKMRRENSDGE